MQISRTICWDVTDCQRALAVLLKSILLATDIETIPFNKKKPGVFCITVVAYTGLMPDGSLHSYAFPFLNGKSPSSGAPDQVAFIYETVRILNESSIRKCLQNGVYDCAWFLYYGLPITNYAYDSMSLFWSRYPDLPKRLDFISSVLLDDYQYWKGDRKSEDFVEYMNYAMSDTESTLRNCMVLIQMAILDDKMRMNFFHAHMRCLAALGMSAMGIAVDEAEMKKVKQDLREEADVALHALRFIVGDDTFNPNSAPQKKELIYGILGSKFRTAKGRFAKRVQDASTGAVPLRAIRSEHPIHRRVANAVLESITPAKQISNVVGLARFPAGSSGSRLLTSYDGVGTTTSRLSSRTSAFGFGGNVQNIRKDYRRIGVADTGCFLLEADFSASDDWFVAFESREQKKMDLARSGLDTHAMNALIFFTNWTYDRIVDGKAAKDPRVVHPVTGVRQITKKAVHGCHYLMAGMTLLMNAGREAIVAAALEMGFEDAGRWDQAKLVQLCETLDHKFRVHYPRFLREHESRDSWYGELRREVVRTGGFYTPFRYFQRFLSDPREDSTLRAVAATAGQAGTAGRINMAMDELIFGYIPKRFRDGPNESYGDRPNMVSASSNGTSLRLQTHDSMSFNVDPKHHQWKSGFNSIINAFQRPVLVHGETFRVGIEVDVSIRWAGKEGITLKANTPEEVIPWLEKNSLQYHGT